MSTRPWTLLKSHARAELWRQDRLDPSGNPVSLYRGSTFIELPGGERRKTPDNAVFRTLADGEAWFSLKTGADVA